MVKLVYCITKRPGLTGQQFFDYWKNVHGPIGSRIPGLRKLVQSHRLIITLSIILGHCNLLCLPLFPLQ